MNLIIRLGIVTFYVSMFFVACSIKEDEIIPDSLPETESEETEEHPPLPEGVTPIVVNQQEVSKPSPAPPEQYIVPRPPQEPVAQTEPKTPQEPVTQTVTEPPQEPITQTEPKTPQEPVAQTVTEPPQEPVAQTEPKTSQEPVAQTEPESPQEQVTQADSMYTSVNLNNDVEILFFEESIVGLSQITNRYRILWLASNEKSNGFSKNVINLVAKLSRYSSAESDQYIYNLICSGRSLENRKSLFFQHGIGIGTLAVIDGSAQVYRYGTGEENKVQNKTRLRDYYVSSVTLQGRDLTSVVINSLAGSRQLNRINAPEWLTKEALNVDVSRINLNNYYAGTLYGIWGENGDFSGCDAS